MSTDRGMSYPETVHWQQRGLCEPDGLHDAREHGEGAGAFRMRLAEAISICEACPVQIECAKDAQVNEGAGIRAGRYWAGGRVVSPPTRQRVRFCTACNGPLPVGTDRKTCDQKCTLARQRKPERQSECGTVAGCRRHRRYHQAPCAPCLAADSRASGRRRARRRELDSAARYDAIRTWGRERGLKVHPVGPPSDGLTAAFEAYQASPGSFEAAS